MAYLSRHICADRVQHVLPLFCPFKALTGIPCPGCGMTRALLCMAKGDFSGALALNPFSYFLVFMIILSVVPLRRLGCLPSRAPSAMNGLFILVLVSVFAFWFFERLLPALR
ncbi:MAG TPA: DUF2752 domain-containing protein [Syntrophorhabdaceae bacterium]|nr:DUF2752 domain-containing protein [Syntrophorhabdaceae bacterium]